MTVRRGRFWRDQGAAVAAIYAIALPGLILVGGVAFDYTRLVGMDTELQNGADQAALAGATQLDKGANACARAGNAAVDMLRNITLFSATGNTVQFNGGATITPAADQCGAFTGTDTFSVRFFKVYVAQGDAGNVPATTDADARYVEVRADEETTRYSFTPIAPLLRTLTARAVASMGGAICGTATLSYCNPSLPVGYDPDNYKGRGILIGTMDNSFDGANGTWGYLKIPPANTSSPADIETVLAQDEPTIECRSEDASPIAQPGSTSNLVRAINTRFDIFDNNIVNNNQPCEVLSDCGPAKNVIKDLVKSTGNKWVLPDVQFTPIAKGTSAYDPTKIYQNGATPQSMGLPRDLCHYGTYGASCASLGAIGDIGNGNWPRADYFAKYHSGRAPSNASSITRYETYLWEQAQGYLPSLNNISGGPKGTQYSQPVTVGASGSAFDRRVLTVAFTRGTGGVCPSANDPVTGVTWVDVFFVQPGVSKRGNYPAGVQENSSDPIYVEIIGRSKSSATKQLTQRDKPYLVE